MNRLTKAEKLTLKLFGNDPNYRIELDSRKKITAVQLNDKIEAQPIQAYFIKIVGKQHSYSKLVGAIDNDKPKELSDPIAKISYGVEKGMPVCNVLLDKTQKLCLVIIFALLASCTNVYQGYDKPTNKVIIGRIDTLYTSNYHGNILKWKMIDGNKIQYWGKTKPVGSIDTIYVKHLILKP